MQWWCATGITVNPTCQTSLALTLGQDCRCTGGWCEDAGVSTHVCIRSGGCVARGRNQYSLHGSWRCKQVKGCGSLQHHVAACPPLTGGLCTCCLSCSHNYRMPEAFAGQVVVVVGAANSGEHKGSKSAGPQTDARDTQPALARFLSTPPALLCCAVVAGEDVCRELSPVAEQVVVAARSWKNPEWASDPRPFGPRGNVSRRGMVSALHADRLVEFTQVCVCVCGTSRAPFDSSSLRHIAPSANFANSCLCHMSQCR